MSKIKTKKLKDILERTQIEGGLTVGFETAHDREMFLLGWEKCIKAFIYFLKEKGDIEINLYDK